MPRVLNVAEKPSVAKEVSRILSGGNVQRRNGACVCISSAAQFVTLQRWISCISPGPIT
jgi:hypothetical protein